MIVSPRRNRLLADRSEQLIDDFAGVGLGSQAKSTATIYAENSIGGSIICDM